MELVTATTLEDLRSMDLRAEVAMDGLVGELWLENVGIGGVLVVVFRVGEIGWRVVLRAVMALERGLDGVVVVNFLV